VIGGWAIDESPEIAAIEPIRPLCREIAMG
jgi:hypothetical protein